MNGDQENIYQQRKLGRRFKNRDVPIFCQSNARQRINLIIQPSAIGDQQTALNSS